KEEVMSSGKYRRHDGFNSVQIKNGLVVRLNKNGTIRAVLGKYGEYGKVTGLAKTEEDMPNPPMEYKDQRCEIPSKRGSPKWQYLQQRRQTHSRSSLETGVGGLERSLPSAGGV
ncbi:MAG: hypothetical protein ACKPKO_49100, partial [Candidatus Fonsibacter sp.]